MYGLTPFPVAPRYRNRDRYRDRNDILLYNSRHDEAVILPGRLPKTEKKKRSDPDQRKRRRTRQQVQPPVGLRQQVLLTLAFERENKCVFSAMIG